jgi:hypothetical protein
MKRSDVVSTIISLSQAESLSFSRRALDLAAALDLATQAEVIEHLDYGGIIPESFDHDSTEEKLYAKYCDALLARSLGLLGMTPEVIVERADSADVLATLAGKNMVGDAKAFRLSRTAKNQKDFKVEALNTWRKGADFACLIAPLYQYPNTASQIYLQATRYNVTLLSYNHLSFLLTHQPKKATDLLRLFDLPKTLPKSKDAVSYWSAVEALFCAITRSTKESWQKAVDDERRRLPAQADEQIAFLEGEKQRIRGLTKQDAIEELIEAKKIANKVDMIKRNSKKIARRLT